MAIKSSNMKPLKDDPQRYRDIYYNAFYKMALKEFLFEKVTQFFDTTVMMRLTRAFEGGEEFGVLGVGLGGGPHELHFMKSLRSHFSSINTVGVDPSESMLNKFQQRVAALEPNDESSVSYQLFNGPFSEFLAGSALSKNKYNLITAIHSLYHLGDFETTFTQLASMMKDMGFILVVCAKDNLMTKTFNKFTWMSENTQTLSGLSSTKVREFAQSQGYDVTTVYIPMQWDITEVFDDQSEFGNKLIDFFTQFAFFRQTAPSELIDELVNFWRSVSILDENGRVLALSDEEILLISK
ncbi:histamine N-methyltransferase-like [Lytechinus variegatus]|uniref:histamine N-methyltransferase-like n=1 Tax=Lytechinus variegatus TaxID=7654 RepID=UPI001BB1B3CE|nr:histamine N-methyltransferase-like [Lytechinus variegatus]